MKTEQKSLSDEIEIRDQSGDPFTTVWNWMLERSDLTGTEKLVWIALKSYAGCPEIRPGVQTVARRAGVSIRTAQRCFEVLKKKALIRIESRTRPDGGNATNRYILLPSPRKSGTAAGATVTSTPRCHGDTPPGDNMAPPQVSQCHPKEYKKLIIKKTSTTPLTPPPNKAPAVDPIPKDSDRPLSPSRPTQAADAVFDVDDFKKLINGTAFQKISERALRMIMNKFGSKCVFESLDKLIVIYKRNRRPIKDPVAVLTIALLKGIIPPSDYVPYHERMVNEQKAKEAAELRRTTEIDRRKDEEEAYRRMLERFEALPEQDREIWLNQARSTLAPVLINFKYAVRSKAIELYNRGP